MNYFRRLIDNNDSASVKRFTILIALAILTVTAFMALFVMKTTSPNIALVDKIIDDCMIIIGVGIFGVGVEYWGGMMLERAKAAAAAQILSSDAGATSGNEETTSTKTETKTKKSAGKATGDDEVFEDDSDLKQIKKNLTKSLKQKE